MALLNEKAREIISVAESLMGYPYVWGATGETCTVAHRKSRMSSGKLTDTSRANIQKRCPVLSGKQSACEGCKYNGLLEFDCIGFVNYVLNKKCGFNLYGAGATYHWNHKANFDRYGEIANMPNVVCCVYMKNGAKMSHIGLHVGDGRIIHCSGEVKNGKTTDRGWTHYGVPKGLYTADDLGGAEGVSNMRLLMKGTSGDDVRALQDLLNKLGFNCGNADGIFGVKTETAVRAFQSAYGLTVDGIAGEATLTKLALESSRTDIPVNPPESVSEPVQPTEISLTLPKEAAQTLLEALQNALRGVA